MPNEPRHAAEAEPQGEGLPKLSPARRIKPILVAGVVAIIAAVLVVAVFLKQPPQQKRYVSTGEKPTYSSEVLELPVLSVDDIVLSIPLEEAGAQHKTLRVSVTVRFAPPEGEKLDMKKLGKEFVPRVMKLEPEFRHLIIQELNKRDYGNLYNPEAQALLLKTFAKDFNQVLQQWGLLKLAGVRDVMWKDWSWSSD